MYMFKLEFDEKFVGGGSPEQLLKTYNIGGCDSS